MVRIIDARDVVTGCKKYIKYAGLHGDQKPTGTEIATGSQFMEVDTGDVYAWDEASSAWNKICALGSGGGGGGATNLVTDTFNFTNSGAHNITIPYTGNGFIVSLCIFTVDRITDNTTPFGSLLQQYAIAYVNYNKQWPDSAPKYNGVNYIQDVANYMFLCKISSSSRGAYGSDANFKHAPIYRANMDAIGQSSISDNLMAVILKNKDTMSVYTTSTGGTVGFANNVTYRYVAYYSE